MLAVVAHPYTTHWILFRVSEAGAGKGAGVCCVWAVPFTNRAEPARCCASRGGLDLQQRSKPALPAFPTLKNLTSSAPTRKTRNQILWAACVYLEAVSVWPQLRMMQKSQNVEKFTSHYVFLLGLSRFFSCAHWILQLLEGNRYLYSALGSGLWPIMVLLSEVVQTFILADFWCARPRRIVGCNCVGGCVCRLHVLGMRGGRDARTGGGHRRNVRCLLTLVRTICTRLYACMLTPPRRPKSRCTTPSKNPPLYQTPQCPAASTT